MNEDLLKNGAFSWFELMTTDVAGAEAFYKGIFGWETEKVPMEGGEYTIIKVDGKGVGGMMEHPAECRGMPPSWDTYVTVDDVDAVAGRAESLGGKVLRPPMDIPNVGRFCVIQDPQGAVLCPIAYAEE